MRGTDRFTQRPRDRPEPWVDRHWPTVLAVLAAVAGAILLYGLRHVGGILL